MLTIRTCKDSAHALSEYLRQKESMKLGHYYGTEGICFGKLCAEVGLEVGQPISDEAFKRVGGNLHATTLKQLTVRMKEDRRVGYDLVLSAMKSGSIMAYIGGDTRILEAHRESVLDTLRVCESLTRFQKGQGINKVHEKAAAIASAIYEHETSRAGDPQLHSHCFVFNVTRGSDGKLVALEMGEVFAQTKYLTEVYRNAMAARLHALGYELRKSKNGFEIAGVTDELIARFSKRSVDRDTAIETRRKEVGRELSKNEVAILVRDSREKKDTSLSLDEIRAQQLAQVSVEELGVLKRIRKAAPGSRITDPVSLDQAIEQAREHVFERRSVVEEHELVAEAIRASYGEHRLEQIRAEVAHGKHGLLVVDGRVATLESVEHERALVSSIDKGLGREAPLGRMPFAADLSEEQRKAVRVVLANKDTIQVLRGRAGTGKTTSLTQIIEGCSAAGQGVACFAPSSRSVDVLRVGGAQQGLNGFRAAAAALERSNTVQRLLVDPDMQSTVAQKLLIVDEYGLLSSRDLKLLVDLVKKQECRLLLVGDSGQHQSVEVAGGARLIEKESRVSIAEIKDVRRQAPNSGYLRAAKALAAGDLRRGLGILDEIGSVTEIPNECRLRETMVGAWYDATHGKNARKSSLMVAPTWIEIDSLNRVARERLRSEGLLRGADQEILSLWKTNWSRAQNKDPHNYEPGQVLVARKSTKLFQKGANLKVVRNDGVKIIVQDGSGFHFSVSPRQSGTAWTVCDPRPISLAIGDQIRLQAIGQVLAKDGTVKRVSNGTTLTVAGVGPDGTVRLDGGMTLLSREFVHAYACTSHGAQGLTVDAVFMTDPLSRQGLYVSATRGRENIQIFTADKRALLTAAQLLSEDRTSATEFARQSGVTIGNAVTSSPRRTIQDLRALFGEGMKRGQNLVTLCLQVLNPWWVSRQTQSIRYKPNRAHDPLKVEGS